MAMSFEFIAGISKKISIFEHLRTSRRGRKLLEELRLPETKEELKLYEQKKPQLRALWQVLTECNMENYRYTILKAMTDTFYKQNSDEN